MITSTLAAITPRLHVAIIMDGNGRWAKARGRARAVGHRAGGHAVRRVVEAAPSLGIGTLTLYAFSSDNWMRPEDEVRTLMRLFESHLRSEVARCRSHGVRLSVIGRRDRLPASLLQAIRDAEVATRRGGTLHLRLAVDYSARDAILAASGRVRPDAATRSEFHEALATVTHAPRGTGEVDLLIRTGGERRLSDFLLWECAYAELYFTDVAWPDFDRDALAMALEDFRGRQRRFGGLPEDPRATPAAVAGPK